MKRALLPLFACLLATHAWGASDAWLKFDPGPQGAATRPGASSGWIAVQTFQIDGPLAFQTGSSFSVVKEVDKTSPELMLSCTTGQPIDHATLEVARSGATGEDSTFWIIEMEEVRINKIAVSTENGPDIPLETVGLRFESATFTYIPYQGPPTGGTDGDGDGMPNSYEIANGLNATANDANSDLDHDGLTNINEYRLGTDPRNPTSFFQVKVSPKPDNADQYNLTWNSVANKSYLVQWSPNINEEAFVTLQTVTATSTTTTHSVTKQGSMGFYRVRPAP